MMMLWMLLCGCMLVESIEEHDVAVSGVIIVVLGLAGTVGVIGFGVITHFKQRNEKFFHEFICHHKKGTGACARMLKAQLLEFYPGTNPFIDCDDLTNLDMLFDYVGSQSKNLVVLMSKELLLRPWCIGELCVGKLNKVLVTPVRFPDFVVPDAAFIESYDSIVDINCLAPFGIDAAVIRDMLQWIVGIPSISLPDKLNLDVCQSLAKAVKNSTTGPLATAAESGGSVPAREGCQVPIVADCTEMEATAAALIISLYVLPYTVNDVSTAPYVVPQSMTSLPSTTHPRAISLSFLPRDPWNSSEVPCSSFAP